MENPRFESCFGLEIVRFHGRYYLRYKMLNSHVESLGARIVNGIPADTEKYRGWLEGMRAEYAARERALETHVYEIRDGVQPGYSHFRDCDTLPSELPEQSYLGLYTYIINLDQEVLTMNYSIHWKLGNIPRENNLWFRAITDSIYRNEPTISLELCPEEHMAAPALELPEPNLGIGYDFRCVTPRTNIRDTRNAFLTYVFANIMIRYQDRIVMFGREWSPNSFPFRELTFALVSIASSQAKFHSFEGRRCGPLNCGRPDCNSKHLLPMRPGWLDEEWVGDRAPLLEFGSMSHRPGEPPGASPTETMYWLEDVLVSLVLVIDGEAITKAVEWGIHQGRFNFQIVVLSLFKVAFAEVSHGHEGKPFVEISNAINLSPLRIEDCVSTHPRNRPELKPGMKAQPHHSEHILMNTNCAGTLKRLQTHFPGFAAVINFFEVAANRRAASKSGGILPPELYDRILDFVDYDTWKACLIVSTAFRSSCLRKYRVDDRRRIVAGPFVTFVTRPNLPKEPMIWFYFENIETGKIIPMRQCMVRGWSGDCNWMPVIGTEREALMLEVSILFAPVDDVPVEADSNEDVHEAFHRLAELK